MAGKDKAIDWLEFELSKFSEKDSGNLVALKLADRLQGVEGQDRADLCEAMREWIEKDQPARTWIAVSLIDHLSLHELAPTLVQLRTRVLMGPAHQRVLADGLERLIKKLEGQQA